MRIKRTVIAKQQYIELYDFVPCVVIQLYNVNQQNARFFIINVLIQFFVSFTCFEHHVFISRKTICTCSLLWYFFMQKCMFVCFLEGD